MMPMRELDRYLRRLVTWLILHKMPVAIVFGVIAFVVLGILFWGVLVAYIGPKDVADRQDVVQVFALVIAGVIGAIGGIVGILNLHQHRDLEVQRAQEDALQSYFEQMGDLLTDHNLIGTDREDIRQLAQAQTFTVAARLDKLRKGALVRFLHGAGLINNDNTIVQLKRADFRGADLSGATLFDADLSDAKVTEEQLVACKYLEGANMPNGQKYEDWIKAKTN